MKANHTSFKRIRERAARRKGGLDALMNLMPPIIPRRELNCISDDRVLSMMTKCVHQAGFSWRVIEQKWPEFEQAYHRFNPDVLSLLSDEQWEAYTQDRRVVRNWQKIKSVRGNLIFVLDTQHEHGQFSNFLSQWPLDDQVGLMQILKKRGERLGGNTGQRVLRNLGWDAFVLTADVIMALQDHGLDIQDNPSSKRDLNRIQSCFNFWHEETGLPYAYLSRIAACSIGENYIESV